MKYLFIYIPDAFSRRGARRFRRGPQSATRKDIQHSKLNISQRGRRAYSGYRPQQSRTVPAATAPNGGPDDRRNRPDGQPRQHGRRAAAGVRLLLGRVLPGERRRAGIGSVSGADCLHPHPARAGRVRQQLGRGPHPTCGPTWSSSPATSPAAPPPNPKSWCPFSRAAK